MNIDMQRLYAILETARDQTVYPCILESELPYVSLYDGAKAAIYVDAAPYLIPLDADVSNSDRLLSVALAEKWCVFIESPDELTQLRRHLCQLTQVELDEHGVVHFRFYDPKVLRCFLPGCSRDELASFFGGITAFYCPGSLREQFFRFGLSTSNELVVTETRARLEGGRYSFVPRSDHGCSPPDSTHDRPNTHP